MIPLPSLLRAAALAAAVLTTLPTPGRAQPSIDFPAASPTSTLKQRVGLTDFEIVYARPSVKGREIFGGLEAWGKVWRTGANAATRITFNTPITFGGQPVDAGSYLLFSIPQPDEWTVILQKDQRAWGAYTYDPKNDVVRVRAKPEKLTEAFETFLIDINDLRDESATLNLLWDHTKIAVPLTVDVTDAVMPQIQAAMAAPGEKSAGLLFQSAGFYYNHGGDLSQALQWVEQALEQQPKAFYMAHLKANILAKLGRKDEAIAAAKHSTDLAIAAEGPKSGFVMLNQQLIERLQ